jgi:hypothetical protein
MRAMCAGLADGLLRLFAGRAHRVWRSRSDGTFELVGSVERPSYGDSGLAPQSFYRWRVSAVVDGVEGPLSTEASATTRPMPAPCDTPGTCPINR